MNELEKYRDEMADNIMSPFSIHHLNKKFCYSAGFDAAISLELPVLFMWWSADLLSLRKDGHILHMLPEVSKQDRWYTEKELYQYWIDNVYKPTT